MTLKTAAELEKLQAIGKIVAEVLARMGQVIKPGLSTQELDNLGRKWLTESGARSAPELTYNFPGATCISVNQDVAHGIPGDYQLQAGDLVNIDVSAEKEGFFADTGASFVVTPASSERQKLCLDGKEILMRTLAHVRAGLPLNSIGRRLQKEAQQRGYTLIQNLGSHGVGRSLHEAPEFIAPYPDSQDRRMLKEGMVITIEPFVSTGAKAVFQADDGWTLSTKAGYDTVQYEHTLVVTKDKPIIIT
jgi:methionyl aminopeptidase